MVVFTTGGEDMELKGSRTEANLKIAFQGECEARTKYDYYASQAKKDGYEQIKAIFEETSANEKEHAKLWFKLLHGGKVPSTPENLLDAAQGEKYEYSEMYKEFAEIAREEGFDEIAEQFDGVAGVEKEHEKRYLKLLNNIEKEVVFKKNEEKVWKCRNCGHIYTGKEALDVCPVCDHPQSHMEINCENY